MGPFKVLACTAPNTYRLDISATWRVVMARRPACLGGNSDRGSPPPVVGADGAPDHKVQDLLKFKMRYGRPYVLVRWAGALMRRATRGCRSTT